MTVPQWCPCARRHTPPITKAETDKHHSPPQSYPTKPGAIRRVDRVCVATHRRIHRLLNLYVRAGGTPPKAVLKGFRPIELELAAYSWANADHTGGRLPYTLADGMAESPPE